MLLSSIPPQFRFAYQEKHAALLIILDTHIYETSKPMARSPFLEFCFPMQDLSGDYDTYTSNANLLIIEYTL